MAATDPTTMIEPHIVPLMDPEFLDFYVHVLSKNPPPQNITLESFRANPDALRPQVAVDASTGFARVHDYTLPTADGVASFPVRAYHPDPAEHGVGPYGLHLNFHGGGFVLGDLQNEAQLCLSMREAGVVVVDVNYRHCPESPFGAAFEDAWTALLWARNSASELNIKPDSISVGGVSAGAHITLYLQQRARDEGVPLVLAMPTVPPAHESLFYRYYTDSPFQSFHDFYHGPILPWGRIQFFQRFCLPSTGKDGDVSDDARREALRAAVPIHVLAPLKATNWKGLCNSLVRTGELDMLRDEGEAYAQKLVQGGNQVSIKRYLGSVHTFMYMSFLSKKREFDGDSIIALRAAHGLPAFSAAIVKTKVDSVLDEVAAKQAIDKAAKKGEKQ